MGSGGSKSAVSRASSTAPSVTATPTASAVATPVRLAAIKEVQPPPAYSLTDGNFGRESPTPLEANAVRLPSSSATDLKYSENGELLLDNDGDSDSTDVDLTVASLNASLDLAGLSSILDSAGCDMLLLQYAAQIFLKADRGGHGYLDEDDFCMLVQSPTLNLNITSTESLDMMKKAAVSCQDRVVFADFMLVIKTLLHRHSLVQKELGLNPGWQWFGLNFDDPALLPSYYNTVHQVMTYNRPPAYIKETNETQSFFQVRIPSINKTFTTYVDDETKEHVYLDWDSGAWSSMPQEWLEELQIIQEEVEENGYGDSNDDVVYGDKMERFTHGVTGVEYEASYEAGKRFFYDDRKGSWEPIPLSLELHVPSIVVALSKLQEIVGGTSLGSLELLLSLRSHDYNVTECMKFWSKEKDFGLPAPTFRGATLHDSSISDQLMYSDMAGQLSSELVQVMSERDAASTKAQIDLNAAKNQTNEASEQFQRDLQQSNSQNSLLTKRTSDLERQLQDKTMWANAAQTNAKNLEEKLQKLRVEMEQLASTGGNWKSVADEKEKTIMDVSGKLVKIATELDRTRSRVSFAVDHAHHGIAQLQLQKTSLKDDMKLLQKSTRQMMSDFTARFLARSGKEVELATRELVAKYRYEVRQRKLLYNQIQELKGNIRVFCRIRKDDRVPCVLKFPKNKDGFGDANILVVPKIDDSAEKQFEFDRVYAPDSTQSEVFDDTEACITSCVDGYNVCIIAYGQTGSGKTHTMMGTPDNEGVNRRAVRTLISILNERKEQASFVMKICLLEIYNEKIIDLLSSGEGEECQLRLNPDTKLPFVDGRTDRSVTTVEDVVICLADADRNRHVASTKMNSQSSRSHLILQITVSSFDFTSKQSSTGKLTLVDLAGSERIAKTEATGQRLVEAAAINKSLSALGQVFGALRQSLPHIPYRNCKLTHLLQDSLGGDAKTCLFINASPAESNLPETIGSLKFGAAIRTIERPAGGTTAPKTAHVEGGEVTGPPKMSSKKK